MRSSTPTPLIECVPNISEGRDRNKIDAIAAEVETVEGVKLLGVEPGHDTHRTVITFVGPPEPVIEAAFRLIRKAAELIDMRHHRGEHPRMGATDVCPLVPVRDISMDEVVKYAHRLGERVGRELGIPGYYYENSCQVDVRRNLAYCRHGQYEGLDKLSTDEGRPDFGPAEFNESVKRTGATAISARNFLVAYNINLDTTSVAEATALAGEIRESGRIQRHAGEVMTDNEGRPVRLPGTLKHVKGIGWYLEEYGIAQLSLNLTNIDETPVHVAFEEARRLASNRGIRVTGSEIVGLVPLRCMLEAADFYLTRDGRSLDFPESEKIEIAVKNMGLDDLTPFEPKKKIIEYKIAAPKELLVSESLESFADRVSGDSITPAGGSVAAYCGVLAAALAGMVANLSAHKRKGSDRSDEFSPWVAKAETLRTELLAAVDEDAKVYDAVVAAYRLPKSTPAERSRRTQAIEETMRSGAEAPLEVARTAVRILDVLHEMARLGKRTATSDASVGAMCARAAVRGATLNVRTNLVKFEDREFARTMLDEVARLESQADERERAIYAVALQRMRE